LGRGDPAAAGQVDELGAARRRLVASSSWPGRMLGRCGATRLLRLLWSKCRGLGPVVGGAGATTLGVDFSAFGTPGPVSSPPAATRGDRRSEERQAKISDWIGPELEPSRHAKSRVRPPPDQRSLPGAKATASGHRPAVPPAGKAPARRPPSPVSTRNTVPGGLATASGVERHRSAADVAPPYKGRPGHLGPVSISWPLGYRALQLHGPAQISTGQG